MFFLFSEREFGRAQARVLTDRDDYRAPDSGGHIATFQQDMSDVAHLLKVLGLTGIEQAIEVLAEFFPNSASDADKQRFVLKRLFSGGTSIDAPHYPSTGR